MKSNVVDELYCCLWLIKLVFENLQPFMFKLVVLNCFDGVLYEITLNSSLEGESILEELYIFNRKQGTTTYTRVSRS